MTNRKVLKYILSHLQPYKWNIGAVILALSFVAGSILSLGRAVKFLIDNGLKAHDVSALNSAILYIITLIVILGAASFIRSYFINSIGEKVINDIRRKVYSHLLSVKYIEFERLKVSDIVSRLSGDIELTSRIIVDIFSFCIRNSIMFCGGLIMMFGESPKLSLMVLIMVPLILITLTGLGRKVRLLSKNNQASLANLSEFISETFSGIRAVYASNVQDFKRAELEEASNKYLDSTLYRLKIRSLFFALSISAIMCSITAVIWIGSNDVLDGSMSSGQLVSFIFYAASAALSIGGISEVFGDLQRCLAASERVFELLEIAEVENNHSSLISPHSNENQNQNEGMVFERVSFTYPTRPEVPILKDLSFKVKQGQFIGIVGRSGSGKSTIMQLLLKFFERSDGEIKIDNQDIDEISTYECRKNFGYIPQDPFMFSATIKENISLGSKSNEGLEDAIYTAAIDEFVNSLSDGLDTYIGARGSEISGGQRQRIAIARALLSKPNILLLDEATSSLDQATESLVMERIRQKMQDRTIIAIAHRISSVQYADKIFVIDQGKVLASGRHEELLATCKLYKKLCNEEL